MPISSMRRRCASTLVRLSRPTWLLAANLDAAVQGTALVAVVRRLGLLGSEALRTQPVRGNLVAGYERLLNRFCSATGERHVVGIAADIVRVSGNVNFPRGILPDGLRDFAERRVRLRTDRGAVKIEINTVDCGAAGSGDLLLDFPLQGEVNLQVADVEVKRGHIPIQDDGVSRVVDDVGLDRLVVESALDVNGWQVLAFAVYDDRVGHVLGFHSAELTF